MPDGSDSFSKAGIAPPQPINFPAFDEVIGGQNPDLYEWLESRRKYNQRAGGLHRVHNGLYDLSGFVHPGGQDWLELTRGQDITWGNKSGAQFQAQGSLTLVPFASFSIKVNRLKLITRTSRRLGRSSKSTTFE